ncbi:MAG: hypothetical protein JXR97_16560 [Planctomycetes bacterium]|nr:hypothetical protein [Planctomycetota bacterium]
MIWNLISNPKFFPTLLSVLELFAAARYGFCSDWGRVMYWTCAAGITFAATWLMGH